MKALTIVAALLCGQAEDPDLRTLVAQLDGLREDCATADFLNRPALMELVARADAAVPALARALESSPSWSIRASAAYALAINQLHDDAVSPLKSGWDRLLDDPHPVVRAVAAQASRSAKAREVLSASDAARRLSLPLDTADWLPEDYYRRRMFRYVERARTARPFGEAPDWPDLLNARLEPEADAVARVLLSEAQFSKRGHPVASDLLDAAFKEPPGNPLRMGYLLSLAAEIPVHSDASHPRHSCPVALEFFEPLLSLVSRSVWEAREPYLLHKMISTLVQLATAGYEPALKLLEQLSRDHPVEQVRSKSEWYVKDIAELKRSADYNRKVEELRRQEALRASTRNPLDPRAAKPPKPPGPAPRTSPPPTFERGMLAGIAAAAALLLTLAVLLRRRA